MKQPLISGEARFTKGPVMRHIIELTVTGAIGLMAIFFVDFLSLLYISWLKDETLTAGVGFATTVLFFATSFNIGLMIAIGALVSRAVGAGSLDNAKRLAWSCLIWSGLTSALVSVLAMPFLELLLTRIGASGHALVVARDYLWITMPANALMALGMGLSSVLRAVGDPRRAMNVTLAAGIVTAFMDPLLIFGFHLGVTGAAIATVISRIVFIVVGFYSVIVVHRFTVRPSLTEIRASFRPLFGIAGPAILTNIATPVANAFIMRSLAPFGDAIIAGNTILDRLVPLAFGALFALTGALGPIFGQNLGARRYDRLSRALRDALLCAGIYVGVVWLLLLLGRDVVPAIFGATGKTAEYVRFFCLIAGLIWGFNGMLFVANTAFNNLGFPLLSTGFNWARATLGTVPFAAMGAMLGGPSGLLIGVACGSALFGTLAILVAFRQVGRLESRDTASPKVVADGLPP